MPRCPLLRHAHITVVERGFSFAFSSSTQWPSILHYLSGEPEESRMKERKKGEYSNKDHGAPVQKGEERKA